MPREVVITGMGINCSLGNTLADVSHKLRHGISGIDHAPEFAEHGFESRVLGRVRDPNYDAVKAALEPQIFKSTGEGNLLKYNLLATYDALIDSGLWIEDLEPAGMIIGSGGPSTIDQVHASLKVLKNGRTRGVSPRIVLPTMASGAVATAATGFKVRRMNYAVSAACATSAIAITNAADQILLGRADVMIAGGVESADWHLALGFDAMGAMTRAGNDNPTKASRAFDADRKGFVLSEGAGILVLEEKEHALERGAKIYGKLRGYGLSSDGDDLTSPSLSGPQQAMWRALSGYDGGDFGHDPDNTYLFEVDYVNAHGTATEVGDANELRAIAAVWEKSDTKPWIGSTKSLSGHSLGAAGAHEAIYTLLMMQDGFLAPSVNIDTLDPVAYDVGLADRILREGQPHADVGVALSNSFGFGGVNASLLFERHAA